MTALRWSLQMNLTTPSFLWQKTKKEREQYARNKKGCPCSHKKKSVFLRQGTCIMKHRCTLKSRRRLQVSMCFALDFERVAPPRRTRGRARSRGRCRRSCNTKIFRLRSLRSRQLLVLNILVRCINTRRFSWLRAPATSWYLNLNFDC